MKENVAIALKYKLKATIPVFPKYQYPQSRISLFIPNEFCKMGLL